MGIINQLGLGGQDHCMFIPTSNQQHVAHCQPANPAGPSWCLVGFLLSKRNDRMQGTCRSPNRTGESDPKVVLPTYTAAPQLANNGKLVHYSLILKTFQNLYSTINDSYRVSNRIITGLTWKLLFFEWSPPWHVRICQDIYLHISWIYSDILFDVYSGFQSDIRVTTYT